jgi:hypothetical protein
MLISEWDRCQLTWQENTQKQVVLAGAALNKRGVIDLAESIFNKQRGYTCEC